MTDMRDVVRVESMKEKGRGSKREDGSSHDYYHGLYTYSFLRRKRCTSHPEIAVRHLHGSLQNFWAATNRYKPLLQTSRDSTRGQ